MTPHFFGLKTMNLLVFFDCEGRECVPTPYGLCRARWDEWDAVYASFSRFCYAGVFGDLGDPVVPTLSGASGDVVTAYAS